MRPTIVIVALAVAFALPATASARSVHSTRALVSHLRAGIAYQRSMTWTYQARAGIPRTPTSYAERRTRSAAFLRWLDRRWSRRRRQARRLVARVASTSVPATICRVFGPALCATAEAIAWRESRDSTSATNGTHWGLFQLDRSALDAYASAGYSTAYQQAVAALKMYRARGWEPWTCCE